MPNHARRWADCTTRDIAALDRERTVVVLPVAATEAHGPHLPLSTDTTIVEGIVDATIDRLPADATAVFLPTVAIGHSPEHAAFEGTLSLSAPTLLAVWQEIGTSVARAGFHRLVLLNAHGGQSGFMSIVNHDLRVDTGLMVWSIDWFRIALPDGLFAADELRYGLHGGDVETSLMLAIAPARVRMDEAEHFRSMHEGVLTRHPAIAAATARWGWASQDLHPMGVAGNAAAATAAKGQAALNHVATIIAAALVEVSRLPLSMQQGR